MRHSMFLIVILTSAAFLVGTAPASAACSGCQGAVEKACKKMGKSCTMSHNSDGSITGCTPNVCFDCRNGNCFGGRAVTGGGSVEGDLRTCATAGLATTVSRFLMPHHSPYVASWHIASIRGNAAFRSLSERSGH